MSQKYSFLSGLRQVTSIDRERVINAILILRQDDLDRRLDNLIAQVISTLINSKTSNLHMVDLQTQFELTLGN